MLAALGHALSLGSHYMGVLLIACPVSIAAIAVWKRVLSPRRAIELCLVAGAGFLVWLPWFATSLRSQLDAPWGFTIKNSPRDLVELPVRQLVIEPDVLPRELWFAGYLLGAVLLAGLAWFLVRTFRQATLERLCIVASFIAPVGAALIVVRVVDTGFQPKYLMNAAAGTALMVGAGLAALPGKWLRRSACAYALLGCLSITLLHKRGNLREDYRGACAETVASWQPKDRLAVVTSTPQDFSHVIVRHYLRERPDILKGLIDDTDFEAKLEQGLQEGERLHVIYRDAYYSEPSMTRMAQRWKLVQRDSRRYRLEHSLWTTRAGAAR